MQKTKCEFCGKEIWRKPSYLKKYKHFYCDRKCLTGHAHSKIPRVNCAACEKQVILGAGRKRNSKTGLYFCGNKCKNPYIARHRRWSQNPDCHRLRRPIILKAANYKCQNCGYGDDERMFDIHHADGNHKNNDWSNLRCLCVWCHMGFHRGCVTLIKLPDLSASAVDLVKKNQQQQQLEQRLKLDLSKKRKIEELKGGTCSGCGISIMKETKTNKCRKCLSKDTRKAERPKRTVLLQQVKDLGYCGVGRLYGVSDNAIRKWIQSGA